MTFEICVLKKERSLSARRAWIEIAQGWRVSGRALVALRKESVDRNNNPEEHGYTGTSLSARRAWIEITVVATLATLVTSLSARRAWIEIQPLWSSD